MRISPTQEEAGVPRLLLGGRGAGASGGLPPHGWARMSHRRGSARSRKDRDDAAEAADSRKERVMTNATNSPFFEVLYEQKEPVGDFGRGTHYSVLRAPVWQDGALKPLKQAQLLDFAVIWDDDHDERVMEVIDLIYLEGLLAPVRYIGERKGSLTIVADAAAVKSWSEAQWASYCKAVDGIGPTDDPWPTKVEKGSASGNTIIHADAVAVGTYLAHIELLWDLGLKPRTDHIPYHFVARTMEDRVIEQAEAARSEESTARDAAIWDRLEEIGQEAARLRAALTALGKGGSA